MARSIKGGTRQREVAIYDGRILVSTGETVVVSDDEYARLSSLISSGDLIDLGATTDDPILNEGTSGGLALPPGENDGDTLTWDAASGLWIPGAPSSGDGGIGSGVLAFTKVSRSSGDITLNSTSITELSPTTGALDLVLPAQAGDLIEVSLAGVYNAVQQAVGMDAYTMVGG